MGIIMLVKALRHRRQEARELLPARLHDYLDRRVLPSSWYPEADYAGLLRATGRLYGYSRPEHFQDLGAAQARHDLEQVYRVMVRLGDPVATLERLEGLWRLYHDSGRLRVALEGDAQAAVIIEDYPLARPDVCGVTGGFVAEALSLAGAVDVKLAKLRCRLTGHDHCRWQLRWSD
ncbi:MAG: hypothetical protein D6696_19250 [Acidobacteria bacterium]|nr:MAG: hypothetical protein D6696_19250 [Acidobacteriota bacterium]